MEFLEEAGNIYGVEMGIGLGAVFWVMWEWITSSCTSIYSCATPYKTVKINFYSFYVISIYL